MTNTTLLIAPAAAGKTRAALQALAAPRRGRAIVLVADHRQRRRLWMRLNTRSRVRVHQFYSLTRLILRRTHPDLVSLNPTLQTLLLRDILRDMAQAGRLPIFASVAHKPGFIATTGACITEAQEAEVAPQALAEAGVSRYDAELGAIYAAYTAAIERLHLADSTRLLLLARDTLRHNPRLLTAVSLLVVDGFDQFTPLQLSLLSELTQQVEQVLITLTGSAQDRPAHRRFIRTRAQLVAALQPTISYLNNPPAAPPVHPGSAVLTHIEQHLFNLDAPPLIVNDGTLTVITAADREREVRAVLRRVQTLLQQNIAPEQVAILCRDSRLYAPLLREVATEYALPLALYEGLALNESPPILTVLTMLWLPLEDYPRRALVEVWRNLAYAPCWLDADHQSSGGLSGPHQAASLLDRVARTAGVTGGLERLRAVLTALAQAEPVVADDDLEDVIVQPATAMTLLALLNAWVDWLSPPEQATIADYSAWVREHTLAVLEYGSDGADQAAEISRQLARVLDELAQAAQVLRMPPVLYRDFMAELSAAIASARYGRDEPAADRVAVLPILAARGDGFDHVFLLGMAEGEFPLHLGDPPFYSRRERTLLAQHSINLRPPDPADERSLFYEAVTRARRSLTLARTYLDERGNPLAPSPYLLALLSLLQPASVPTIRVTAGSVPDIDEAASDQETLIAVMQQAAGDTSCFSSNSESKYEYLPLLQHVRRACAIERQREGSAVYGAFEGVLDDPDLIAELSQRFGPAHRWSITQLNNYITCPFRFAAAHILKLEQRTEPEDGLEQAGRGRLYHAILAEAGKQWMQAAHVHSSDHEAAILDALHAAADQVLAAAPARYGFAPDAFWGWDQADVRRRLIRALQRALRAGDEWSELRTAGVEQGFGLRAGAPPLQLTTTEGTILVVGRIDRIDQHPDGSLALIDYKSSSTPRSLQETLSGRDVQLAIYLLATEQLLVRGQQVERAAFFHLGSGKRSTPLTAHDRETALSAMTARVAEVVAGVRAGQFAVRPRDDCPRGCAFKDICRLNKAKRGAPESSSR